MCRLPRAQREERERPANGRFRMCAHEGAQVYIYVRTRGQRRGTREGEGAAPRKRREGKWRRPPLARDSTCVYNMRARVLPRIYTSLALSLVARVELFSRPALLYSVAGEIPRGIVARGWLKKSRLNEGSFSFASLLLQLRAINLGLQAKWKA